MAAFVNTFSTSLPVGTNAANAIDDYIRADTKAALNERLALEHQDLVTGGSDTQDITAQGRHKAGYVGFLGYGTYAEMTAITTAGKGAFWELSVAGGGYDAGTTFRCLGPGSGWTPSQLASGTIYASQAEVDAGTASDVALAPLTFEGAAKWADRIEQAVKVDTQIITGTGEANNIDVTDLSVTITPRYATSKIIVQVEIFGGTSDGNFCGFVHLDRGGTLLGEGASAGSRTSAIACLEVNQSGTTINNCSFCYVDSPATTSATTYKIAISVTSGQPVYINRGINDTDAAVTPRLSSSITAWEIFQ